MCVHVLLQFHCFFLGTKQPQSLWAELSPDVLAKVLEQNSRLCCILQHVCKAWRKETLKHPVGLNISITSQEEQDSLALWLQHNNLSSATHLQQAAHHNDLRECETLLKQRLLQAGNAQSFLLNYKKHLNLETVISDHRGFRKICDGSDDANAIKEDVKSCCRQISSLTLSVWACWRISFSIYEPDQVVIEKGTELSHEFWHALQTARVQRLTLGEFPSEDFIKNMHYIVVPSSAPWGVMAPSLRRLEALTLHLNCFSIGHLFHVTEGSMYAFGDLRMLTSLTLRASEVLPYGDRQKYSIPADRLLHSLPSTLRTLSLLNFRDRWDAFQDLSIKPSLVNLDLSESCFFLPEASAWTQVSSLTLKRSVAWLRHETPFDFHALTQLTSLQMPGCVFGVHQPRMLGNPHNYKYNRLQAPTSIVHLNIDTRSVKVSTSMQCCDVASAVIRRIEHMHAALQTSRECIQMIMHPCFDSFCSPCTVQSTAYQAFQTCWCHHIPDV